MIFVLLWRLWTQVSIAWMLAFSSHDESFALGMHKETSISPIYQWQYKRILSDECGLILEKFQ